MAFRLKRKKLTKYRGSKTHGCGSMKKRRGAGSRGGRGMAGTGKRGDANKPSVWANKKYFGKRGFKPQNQVEITACSLFYLETKLPRFIESDLVKEEKGVFVVDLEVLGFNKLLSQGKVTKKYNITTRFASTKAIEKVKAEGGDVIVQEVAKEDNSEAPDNSKTKKTKKKETPEDITGALEDKKPTETKPIETTQKDTTDEPTE
jgi:large subunit ribosomal protein L15